MPREGIGAVSRPRLDALVVLFFAASAIGGCQTTDSGPPTVVFGGQRYTGMESAGLTLTEDVVREIGTASEVSEAGGIATNAVYEISGISPRDAIAMRGDAAVDAPQFLLFVRGPYPTGLCRYESDPARAPACG